MGKELDSLVDRYRTPEGLFLLKCWARDMSLDDVAKRIGIARSTLWSWRNNYPEIKEAITESAEVLDYKVENSLLRSALGYKVVETKTIINEKPDASGNRIVRMEKTEKEIAPSVTAAAMWLNNRKPEQWKRNRDNVLEMTDDQSHITVNIVKHGVNTEDKEEWNVCSTSAENENKRNVLKESTEADVSSDDDDDWSDVM